jgi:hypothetical protein
MDHEIFVSYSQPDREHAFELTEHLELNGLRVWIAPRNVSPAAEWAAEIIDAISSARVMVLLFSANSNGSPQVRREVERAVSKDIRILTFRIEEVLPSKSLEYFLSGQHWLDGFPPPREAHYARLCTSLRRWLSADESALAPPPEARTPGLPAAPAALRSVGGGPAEAMRVPPSQLRAVEARLAALIGPVARMLVQRAAAGATDLEDLERRLAAELDCQEDRRRFVAACQWSQRQPR